jgi:hypothetical protein
MCLSYRMTKLHVLTNYTTHIRGKYYFKQTETLKKYRNNYRNYWKEEENFRNTKYVYFFKFLTYFT